MTGVRAIIVLFAVATGLWLAASVERAPAPLRSRLQSPNAASGEGPALPGTQTYSRPLTVTPGKRTITGSFDGLAIQVYSAHDALEKYGRLIGEVADMGAKCVMLSVNGYQERVESTVIRTKPEECPPDEVWLQLFDRAHEAGLKVVLMPKILLAKPNGKWRGKIQPPSWDVWFTQYGKFVRHFAELAEAGGVEMLIVGSELISTEKHTKHWKTLIGDTRRVFGGLLAYSANWDHYTGIRFWEDLDAIGLTTYHQLSDEAGPTPDELREAWKPIRDKILAWRETVGRPIIFTEVGWCSQEGCSVEAWNYYRKEEATPAGHEEQRRNYQAFIDTWGDEPTVAGMIWWEWDDRPGGADDYGYTPRKKPAEAVLREAFNRKPRGHSSIRCRHQPRQKLRAPTSKAVPIAAYNRPTKCWDHRPLRSNRPIPTINAISAQVLMDTNPPRQRPSPRTTIRSTIRLATLSKTNRALTTPITAAAAS